MLIIENAIKTAAQLRGEYKFQDAIDVVKAAIKQTPANHELIVIANIQGLHAAEEGGLPDEAKRFAEAIKVTDPDLPSIKKYFV